MNGLVPRVDRASAIRFAEALLRCIEATGLDDAAADALINASVGDLVHLPLRGPISDGVASVEIRPSPALLDLLPGLHRFYSPEGAAMPP